MKSNFKVDDIVKILPSCGESNLIDKKGKLLKYMMDMRLR